MKKYLFILLLLMISVTPAFSTDTDEEIESGISLSGELMAEEGNTFLVVSINVFNVTSLNAARVDVEYDTDALELVNVLDDVDIESEGRQNFLGTNVLSVDEIKEFGVAEYAISRIWEDGEAPAGSSGIGIVGLLVFRILKNTETTLAIRRETLQLMNRKDFPISEQDEEFRVYDLTFDPNAE